jgi:capsular polysaccharide transport system ATP-binding protein
MIRLENLTKVFRSKGERKLVIDRANAVFPSGVSVGLIGRNGAGKSSLLKIIAGTLDATEGRVVSNGTISWPVGFAGSFHPELTGAQNTRFLARVYGVDTDGLMAFTEEFADLGKHFYLPFRTYSSGMRGRLAFGVSMGIRFDTYLVDEVTAVGDVNFRAKSEAVFRERLRNSGAVVVSHGVGLLRRICQAGCLLHEGKLTYFDDVNDAIDAYHDVMNVGAEEYDDD